MKILFYNHTGKVSGAERVLLMILRGLDRNRFVPVVVCPEDGALMKMTSRLDVACESIPGLVARFTRQPVDLVRYLCSFVFIVRALRRKVIAINPDLLHANSIRSGLVASAATLGLNKRVVWHLHDLLPRHPLSSAIRILAFLFKRAQMIAVSEAVANNFAGAWRSLHRRVCVLLNGIELEKFRRDNDVRDATRKELHLEDTDFAIGIVGLLTPRKGQLGLIHAFAKVSKRIPGARLFIVGSAMFDGDEQYEAVLRNTTNELGIADRISFLGARDDVPALMSAFDLLVLNSTVEPFGLVVLEAMASKTPIVAANSGGIPEIVRHGKNGLLVGQGNSRQLVDSIIYLAQRPDARARMSNQANEDVETRFSHTRVLAELQDFYEPRRSSCLEVANGRGRRLKRLAEEV